MVGMKSNSIHKLNKKQQHVEYNIVSTGSNDNIKVTHEIKLLVINKL